MKIFQLENNSISIEPEILLIPEFKKIYDKDKTKTKEKSFNTFEYIYFVNDWNSPYRVYTDIDDRKRKVKKDYIKEKDWTEDVDVKAALDKYNELSKTPIMRLIEDAYVMVDKLRSYFLQVDFNRVDKMGKKIDKATEGMSNLEKLGKVVESLKRLEEMAAKEKLEKTSVRANREVSYDER